MFPIYSYLRNDADRCNNPPTPAEIEANPIRRPAIPASEPAFLHNPIWPMFHFVLSLFGLPCLACLCVPARRLKGHTRDGPRVDSFLLFCGFGAKVTENKGIALCKFSNFLPAIFEHGSSNAVTATGATRPKDNVIARSRRRRDNPERCAQISGLRHGARNDGAWREGAIVRYIRARLWATLSAGNIMSGTRNILSNITQNRRSLARSLTNFEPSSRFPAAASICYAQPYLKGQIQ